MLILNIYENYIELRVFCGRFMLFELRVLGVYYQSFGIVVKYAYAYIYVYYEGKVILYLSYCFILLVDRFYFYCGLVCGKRLLYVSSLIEICFLFFKF